MKEKNFFQKIIENIERILPMSFTGFLFFVFIIYLFVIVGRSIWVNYNSNKDLDVEDEKVALLQDQINTLKNEINYFQTYSYKEKQAREKLAYKAPGENVMVIPLDIQEDTIVESEVGEVQIKTPNYRLWGSFLFDDK